MKYPSVVLLLCMLLLGAANQGSVPQRGDELLGQEQYWDAADWFLTGIALNSSGNYEDAAESFRMAISIEPKNALSWLNLGTDKALTGDYQEAIIALEESVRLSPKLAMAYANLGEVYFRAGSFRQSIDTFGRLLVLQPADANAHFKRGLSFLVLGDVVSAAAEYSILRGIDEDLAGHLLKAIRRATRP